MKNLLSALKKLGNKMTGQDITGKNLVTVVDDIAEKYTGGGGGGGDFTVVETTLTNDANSWTVTNATALFDMFEDIAANPEKVFKYGILRNISGSLSSNTPNFETGWIQCQFEYEISSNELYYNDISRSRSDITADDTLVFGTGGGGPDVS